MQVPPAVSYLLFFIRFMKVTEYLFYHNWIFDACYDLNHTSALMTGFYICHKDPFEGTVNLTAI